VESVVGAGRLSIDQQQQLQMQLQQPQNFMNEYVTHWKVVRMYCATDSGATQALNSMSFIALSCMAATAQQQQQQQQPSRQQLLEQYVDAEVDVMAYCAGNSAAIDALYSMTTIALRAINQQAG
jgi:hypothetical protein